MLLLHRKLNDIGHIVRTLRPYSTEDIFSLLLKFNSPSHVKIQTNSFDPEMPTNLLDTHSAYRMQNSQGKQFIPDSRGNIIEGNLNIILIYRPFNSSIYPQWQ